MGIFPALPKDKLMRSSSRSYRTDITRMLRRLNFTALLLLLGCSAATLQPSPAGAQTLTITTTSLPNGVVNVDYPNLTLQASGGTGTLTWSVVGASEPPDGLGLDADGFFYGRPTTVETTPSFTLKVTDSASPTPHTATRSYTVVVQTLQQGVDGLPTDTPAHAAKKAVLEWGLSESTAFSNAGDTTDANNLITDVTGQFNDTYTLPAASSAPNYFPAIANTSSNPSLNGAVTSIQNQLGINDGFHPVWTTVTPPADRIELAMEMTRAFIYPGTTLYQNPELIGPMLTHFENVMNTIALQHNGTLPYTFDFTYAADLPYEYLAIKAAFPQAILPSRNTAYLSLFNTLGNYIESDANGGDEGKHLKAAYDNGKGDGDVANNWINADVRYFCSLAYIGLITGTDFSSYVNGGLAEMQYALLPDGGTNYTDQQNEAQSYHYYYVQELERYYRVAGSSQALALVKDTQWFTPLSQTSPPPGTPADRSIGEWVTAPAWHKYWNENTNSEAMSAVYNYTQNKYVEWQLNQVGFPASFNDARYYPSGTLGAGTAIPTDYIAYDQNIQGTRGVEGPFTYIGTTRPTPISRRGKSSYVGGMVLKPYDGSADGLTAYPLSAAVESAGTIVLQAYQAELDQSGQLAKTTLVDEAANEHNASTTASLSTGVFGALSTVHNISGYNVGPTSWLETETWVLLPTRVIGLVSVTNTASEKAYGLSGGFRVISCAVNCNSYDPPATWSHSGNAWTYGNLAIDVFYTDYSTQASEYTNTNGDDLGGAGWLQLEDSHNAQSGSDPEYTYPAGTSHYFLAEFRPTSSPSANGTVGQLSFTNSLVGFRFQDNGVEYTIVHNPTGSAIAYTPPTGTVTVSGTQYRNPWLPAESNPPNPPAYNGSIPPYSHILITGN